MHTLTSTQGAPVDHGPTDPESLLTSAAKASYTHTYIHTHTLALADDGSICASITGVCVCVCLFTDTSVCLFTDTRHAVWRGQVIKSEFFEKNPENSIHYSLLALGPQD